MKLYSYTILSFLLLLAGGAVSQVTTASFEPTQDSYTTTINSRGNYGSNDNLRTGTSYTAGPRGTSSQNHHRSFVEFDFSSIPSNAIIYSAELKLTVSGSVSGSFSWNTARILDLWDEGVITADEQPSLSVFSQDKSSTVATTSSVQVIDVTNMVQRMVAGSAVNRGWCVQVDNEIVNANTGAWFYSSEHSTESYRPELEIKYYLPHELANVVVTHESGPSQQDGSIELDIVNGSQNFNWTWVDIEGEVVSTLPSLTGVGEGWYGLHIQGDDHPDEHFYYSFIIGQRGASTSVNVRPSGDYTSMAKVSDQVQSGNDYGDVNYGNYHQFIAQRISVGGIYHSEMSFMKFNLWLDPDLVINNADVFLNGANHTGSINSTELNLLTTNWNELAITNNNKPTTSAVIDVSISGTFTSTQDQTVSIEDFWNYWKGDNRKNFGFYFQLQSLINLNNSQSFDSPNASVSSNRPEFQFSVSVAPEYATFTWDPDIGVGDVTGDVSGETSSFPGPYLYMMSLDSIPDQDSLLGIYQSTSMGGSPDQFYGRYTTATSFEFNDYPAATYFLSTFDQNQGRIFQEKVTIQDPLVLENNVGLKIIAPDRVGVSGTSGYGDLNLYTYDGMTSAVKVFVEDSEEDQFFGYANAATTIQNYTDIYYGFRINNGNLNIIENGVLGAFITSIRATDELELKDDQGALSLWINGVSKDTYSAPSSYEHKLGLGMEILNSMRVKPEFMESLVRKEYRFNSETWRYFNCEGVNGGFQFSVSRLKFSAQSCPVSYTIKDSDGNIVTTGSSTTGTTILVHQTSGGGALTPGLYTIEGTMTCSGVPAITISEEVLLGYEVEWTDLNDFVYQTIDNSLERNNVSPSLLYSNAKSLNVLKVADEGIIEFSLSTNVLVDGGKHVFRFTSDGQSVQPNDLAMLNNHFIRVFTYNSVRYLEIYDADNGFLAPFIPVYANTRFRIDLQSNPDQIVISMNGGSPIATLSRPANIATMLRPNTYQLNDAFVDVVSTFGCSEPQIQYAHLDYDLDGYYHVMKNGKIRFVYDQQYDADDLTFNIYNYKDELVKTHVNFPVVNTTHGDNYITLDVSEESNCLGRGYFYLEVITSKKERVYLRYFNDYTHPNCIDYYADPGAPAE